MRTRTLRILTIGHAYVVALNRAIVRHIARDAAFDITVAAPRIMKDELRTIEIESEPRDSRIRLVPVTAYLTRTIPVLTYSPSQIKSLLDGGHFDVIHIWEEPYVFAGFQLSREAHRRQIPFCFRTAQNIIKRYPFPFRYFEKSVWSWCTGWIAGAHLVFQEMVKKGIPQEKGRVLTLAVDSTRFKPLDRENRKITASQLGLTAPIIAYVGRLTEPKGCEVMLQLLQRLDPTQQWSFLAMGSGPYKRRIEQLGKELEISDRVKVVLLKHDEVADILPACDILICPSQTTRNWREQFGRMTIEAFASGVAVIGSNSGEIPYVVGDAGIVVQEDDVDQWVESVEGLLRDEDRRSELAARGLQRVCRYTAEGVSSGYKAFYTWLHERGQYR